MNVIDLNADGMPRAFKPLTHEYKDADGRRTIRGVNVNLSNKNPNADGVEKEAKWNEESKQWELPLVNTQFVTLGDVVPAKKNN